MKYLAKGGFMVPMSSGVPANCQHGWVAKSKCVLCGESVVRPERPERGKGGDSVRSANSLRSTEIDTGLCSSAGTPCT